MDALRQERRKGDDCREREKQMLVVLLIRECHFGKKAVLKVNFGWLGWLQEGCNR